MLAEQRAIRRDTLFRDVYTRLFSLRSDERKIVGITSAIQGEGKSTVALHLAAKLATDIDYAGSDYSPGSVLLINWGSDSDALRETLHVQPGPGFVSFARGQADLNETVKPTLVPRLLFMDAGGSQDDLSVVARNLDPTSMRQRLQERHPIIIADLPPILTTTDTQVLARFVDQVAIVVRAGVTPDDLITQAADEIDRTKVAGVILNDWRQELPSWLEHRL